MAEMVGTERNVPACRLAHCGDDLGRAGDTALGDAGTEAVAWCAPVPAKLVLEARRLADGPTFAIIEQLRPDIELDEGQPQRFPRFDALGVALWSRVGGGRRVGVDSNPVAILAAEELIAGHAVDLPDQIPQRDLDARDPAALAAPVTKLLDRPKDHVHIARVLAQQHALELERVLLVAGVAHLAKAIDALIGIDADDRIIVVAGHYRDPHIGDLEVTRPREGVDGVLDYALAGLVIGHRGHDWLL